MLKGAVGLQGDEGLEPGLEIGRSRCLVVLLVIHFDLELHKKQKKQIMTFIGVYQKFRLLNLGKEQDDYFWVIFEARSIILGSLDRSEN